MSAIAEVDLEEDICAQVKAVVAGGGKIRISGGGSKHFYGEPTDADIAMDVTKHSGVIDYDPGELVITVRAGCRLHDVNALLAANGQMFGFEPPLFGDCATIGGMIATGLAGPRRAFAGGMRDFVLGVKLVDGRGQIMQFGGRVIKNVAGFDVSRAMVGALGTLGIIMEVSIRVIPVFETEVSVVFEQDKADDHLLWINRLCAKPYPISASLWHQGHARLRLSGSEPGVSQALADLGGDRCDQDWADMREHNDAFFKAPESLTRVALPPATTGLVSLQPPLIEWGGAQRWLRNETEIDDLRSRVAALGGNVCAFRHHLPTTTVFHPLPPAMLTLQSKLQSSFDPQGVFNPGRLFPRQ